MVTSCLGMYKRQNYLVIKACPLILGYSGPVI